MSDFPGFDMVIEGAVCQGCGAPLRPQEVWFNSWLLDAGIDFSVHEEDWPVRAKAKAFRGNVFHHYVRSKELCGDVSFTARPIVAVSI